MDMNYILRREQVSLHNARIAKSGPARIAHKALATAYGDLLDQSMFPHRAAPDLPIADAPAPPEKDGDPAS